MDDKLGGDMGWKYGAYGNKSGGTDGENRGNMVDYLLPGEVG